MLSPRTAPSTTSLHALSPGLGEPVVLDVSGIVNAPPEAVWAQVSRTSRNNRLVGRRPVLVSAASAARPLRDAAVAADDPFARDVSFVGGSALRWSEPPASWVAARSYATSRAYAAGILRRSVVTASLTRVAAAESFDKDGSGSAADATRVRYLIILYARTSIGRLLLSCGVARSLLPDFISLLRKLTAEARPGAAPGVGPLERRRASVATPEQQRQLAERGAALRAACGAAPYAVLVPLAERLLDLLERGYDEDVTELRPNELADAWAADRRAVLSVCLLAARERLLEMAWCVACPNCAKDFTVDSLARLPSAAPHCVTCGITINTDADESIELRFGAPEALRGSAPLGSQLYCPSDPSEVPFAILQEGFARAGTAELVVDLPSAALVLRELVSQTQLLLLPDSSVGGGGGGGGRGGGGGGSSPAAADATQLPLVEVDMAEAEAARGSATFLPGMTRSSVADVAPRRFAPGPSRLRIRVAGPAIVRLERSDWRARSVRPSNVAGLREYEDLVRSAAAAAAVNASAAARGGSGGAASTAAAAVGAGALRLSVASMAFVCFEEEAHELRAALKARGAVFFAVPDAPLLLAAFSDGATAALDAVLDAVVLAAPGGGGGGGGDGGNGNGNGLETAPVVGMSAGPVTLRASEGSGFALAFEGAAVGSAVSAVMLAAPGEVVAQRSMLPVGAAARGALYARGAVLLELEGARAGDAGAGANFVRLLSSAAAAAEQAAGPPAGGGRL
jgi:hypothetical protein